VSDTKNDFYFDKEGENKDNMDQQVDLIKINFLGVTIDPENGASNPKIRKALDKSFKLLDKSIKSDQIQA
jgi:hypothetical protein